MEITRRTFLNSRNRWLAVMITLLGGLGLCWLNWRFHQQYAYFGIPHRLVFYFSLFSVLLGLVGLILPFFKLSDEGKNRIWLVFIAFCITLGVSETLLNLCGVNKAYVETRGMGYYSPYVPFNTDTLYIIRPWFPKYVETEEYRYSRIANSSGFRDNEFFSKSDSNTVLLQTYGDSFTEGDGAPADSSYPSILRTICKARKNLVIQNFGVLGSDPGFYWIQLKEIGIKLKPDVIVMSYGTYDLTTDFFTRSGLDRFKNGYWQGFKGPTLEWVYACSYLARMVYKAVSNSSANNFFLNEQEKSARLREVELKWNETFFAIAKVAEKNHIKVLLVKKPERNEISEKSYMYNFGRFEQMIDTLPVFARFDLLPFYTDSMRLNNRNLNDFYWPKDGHHNSTGYALMAQGVNTGLQHCYPEIFATLDSVNTAKR